MDGPHEGGYFKRSGAPSGKGGQKILKNAGKLQTVLVEIEAAFKPDLFHLGSVKILKSP